LSSSQKKRYTLNLFFGAGGGSLPLLEKQMFLKEKDMVVSCSGQWLKCTNPVIAKHEAKCVWKASVGAPMSVPHIDSRMIDGQKAFTPFRSGFS
jgi:malate dehydrogenase (quinone)